jgi:uncharacterized membrane protein YvbJ
MGLIACPECGRGVSDSAPACPACGYPVAHSNPLAQIATARPLARPVKPRGKGVPRVIVWSILLAVLFGLSYGFLQLDRRDPEAADGIREIAIAFLPLLSWAAIILFIVLVISWGVARGIRKERQRR